MGFATRARPHHRSRRCGRCCRACWWTPLILGAVERCHCGGACFARYINASIRLVSPHQWCTRVDKSLTTTDGDSERDEGSSTSRSGSRRNSDSDADDGSASSASDSELQSDAGEAALGVTQVPAVAMVLRPQQLPQMLSLLRGRTHAEHSVPRFWAAVQDAFTLGGARADARWTLALSAVTTVIMVVETAGGARSGQPTGLPSRRRWWTPGAVAWRPCVSRGSDGSLVPYSHRVRRTVTCPPSVSMAR